MRFGVQWRFQVLIGQASSTRFISLSFKKTPRDMLHRNIETMIQRMGMGMEQNSLYKTGQKKFWILESRPEFAKAPI